MTNFAEMGKTELRAACKHYGIKGYGNMTNDGMRAALTEEVEGRAEAKQQARDVVDRRNEKGAQREVAPVAPVAAPAPAAVETTGLKIEQNREKRNGVTRPSIGGKCRAIWDALDEYVADPDNEGEKPTAKVIKAIGTEEGWDKTTTMIQFYQWRKFNGIVGRSK